MADNQLFTLKIITPDRVFYEGEASMVEFNTTEGAIGIYKGHIPKRDFVPKHRKPIFCGQRQHSREHLPVFMY